MNRYLRMGTRRCAAPSPKPHVPWNEVPALVREDGAVIDSLRDELERELDLSDGSLDGEDDMNGSAAPVQGRVWCGERGDYVAVHSPKRLLHRR